SQDPKEHAIRMSAPGKGVAKARILVVDEHSLLRHGIVTYLNCQPDMIVCGEADDIPSTQSKVAECRPQLLVIGLRLGTGDSLELALRAFQKSLETQPQHRLLEKAPRVENLSDREMHVFQLVGSGLGTRKIAHALNLSVKTIETHRGNIKGKLGLHSGAELTERATAWVMENLLPQQRNEISVVKKKKVVPFRAA